MTASRYIVTEFLGNHYIRDAIDDKRVIAMTPRKADAETIAAALNLADRMEANYGEIMQRLFSHMDHEHHLILLESELQDIMRIVRGEP
jgi:hypothetical protein